MKSKKSRLQSIAPDLKSKVMEEILVPGVFVPDVAKKYGICSTTLYRWRREYNKKMVLNNSVRNNFVELVSKESSKDVVLNSRSKNLSEISLKFGDISLSIDGFLTVESLSKLLNCLESC